MNRTHLKRLEKRLDGIAGKPVYIFVSDKNGDEREILFSKWRENYPKNGLYFSRWSRGIDRNYKSLDFILSTMYNTAYAENNNQFNKRRY